MDGPQRHVLSDPAGPLAPAAMTSTNRYRSVSLPELAPSLGRIVSPLPDGRQPVALWRHLRAVRLALAGTLFEAAAQARSELAHSRPAEATRHLGREMWVRAWEDACAAASQHLRDDLQAQIHEAATVSRMPDRRANALGVTTREAQGIAARLGAGGGELLRALDALDSASHTVETHGDMLPWRDAVMRVARRMEAAWVALESAVERELDRWSAEIESVRRWRRPRWPLWALSIVGVALAGYLGLVLGGYRPAPEWLQPVVEWWWSLA